MKLRKCYFYKVEYKTIIVTKFPSQACNSFSGGVYMPISTLVHSSIKNWFQKTFPSKNLKLKISKSIKVVN